MDYETLINQSRHNTAIEQEEYNLFSMLRPRVSIDGNQYCVSYGDMPEGIHGFGDSVYLAVLDFNKQFIAKDLSLRQGYLNNI
jgi:hypothetical protein